MRDVFFPAQPLTATVCTPHRSRRVKSDGFVVLVWLEGQEHAEFCRAAGLVYVKSGSASARRGSRRWCTSTRRIDTQRNATRRLRARNGTQRGSTTRGAPRCCLAPQPNQRDHDHKYNMSCWRKDSDECWGTDDDGERTVDDKDWVPKAPVHHWTDWHNSRTTSGFLQDQIRRRHFIAGSTHARTHARTGMPTHACTHSLLATRTY